MVRMGGETEERLDTEGFGGGRGVSLRRRFVTPPEKGLAFGSEPSTPPSRLLGLTMLLLFISGDTEPFSTSPMSTSLIIILLPHLLCLCLFNLVLLILLPLHYHKPMIRWSLNTWMITCWTSSFNRSITSPTHQTPITYSFFTHQTFLVSLLASFYVSLQFISLFSVTCSSNKCDISFFLSIKSHFLFLITSTHIRYTPYHIYLQPYPKLVATKYHIDLIGM